MHKPLTLNKLLAYHVYTILRVFCIEMSKQIKAVIRAIGSYLPDSVLSNRDLESMVETSDEWIVSRTGIRERRIASAHEHSSTMGIEASKIALQKANIQPTQVDLIITSTMTPDFLCPSTAALIQHGIGAPQAAAFDLQAACSGFLYGLATAKAFVENGQAKTVLLVATEKNSAFVDYTDRNTCILFGDGASACLITQGESGLSSGLSIDHVCLGADGELADLISIPAGGSRMPSSPTSHQEKAHTLKMSGREVFKHAVRRMEAAAKECLDATNTPEKDISWLIPHQANIRIMEAIAKRFSIPWDRVAQTIEKYANTSASTIPLAIDYTQSQHPFQQGDKFLLAAFGGGLTWGAALLTYHEVI